MRVYNSSGYTNFKVRKNCSGARDRNQGRTTHLRLKQAVAKVATSTKMLCFVSSSDDRRTRNGVRGHLHKHVHQLSSTNRSKRASLQGTSHSWSSAYCYLRSGCLSLC